MLHQSSMKDCFEKTDIARRYYPGNSQESKVKEQHATHYFPAQKPTVRQSMLIEGVIRV
jgi:hypothetical protein